MNILNNDFFKKKYFFGGNIRLTPLTEWRENAWYIFGTFLLLMISFLVYKNNAYLAYIIPISLIWLWAVRMLLVYIELRYAKEMVETEATIVGNERGNPFYSPILKFSINGKNYKRTALAYKSYSPYAENRRVKILVNPKETDDIYFENFINVYIVIGVIAVLIGCQIYAKLQLS